MNSKLGTWQKNENRLRDRNRQKGFKKSIDFNTKTSLKTLNCPKCHTVTTEQDTTRLDEREKERKKESERSERTKQGKVFWVAYSHKELVRKIEVQSQ